MSPRSGAPKECPIIESSLVTSEVAEFHVQYSRFHDIYDGLTWRLAREPAPPESVEIAPGVLMVKSAPWPYSGCCQITLVYSLTEEGLVIDDIKAEPVPSHKKQQ